MSLIRLSNRSFLREHPKGDPFITPDPGNEAAYRYIFPGDEIVLWHKVNLPDDVSLVSESVITPTITDIKLISAKASVIAKKSQVFSEEFSVEFKSTRVFDLDSFVTPFNNSNATYQPWMGDGYAPNIHLNQDRIFKLPSGDFRREIKFFTDHTSPSALWNYYFYFPILFRWEYWISLLGASNDFFDMADDQNGQNHWWYHYYTSKWKLFSRLELTTQVFGVPTIIRSELALTPGTGDVNDYSSNSDYTNKSIKTSEVGGTLSNAPALIYGNKETTVIAHFDKVAAWDVGEKANVSAVVWIEPFEGTGIASRTRGSSLYAITPESVFKGLAISGSDSNGLGITDGGGNFVTYDVAGTGAKVLFNSGDDTIITVAAVIDEVKLAQVYPGVRRFTIYARLYNMTTDAFPETDVGGSYDDSYDDSYDNTTITIPAGNRRRKGEEIRQNLSLVSPATTTSVCERKKPSCAFSLDVYADLEDTDALKNDKSAFYEYGDATLANVELILCKLERCDVMVTDDPIVNAEDFNTGTDIGKVIGLSNNSNGYCDDALHKTMAKLSGSTYGNYFSYGKSNDFLNNDFEDDYGKKYTGVFMEWRKVLNLHGAGRYQMVVLKTDVFGGKTATCDPRVFCLKNYNCNIIDRTVRIDVVNEGLRGSLFDPLNFIDYGAGWGNQFRLKGVFRYKNSTYVKEFNQYGDASFNAFKPVINEQQPKFTLSLRPVPGWMDFILSTEVLQADEIRVTDYNTGNRHNLINVTVMNDGDITPADNGVGVPNSGVELAFAYGLNNLRKRNSQ